MTFAINLDRILMVHPQEMTCLGSGWEGNSGEVPYLVQKYSEIWGYKTDGRGLRTYYCFDVDINSKIVHTSKRYLTPKQRNEALKNWLKHDATL